jgi:lipid-A-disaccharide synthase
MADTPARQRQLEAFSRLDAILGADDSQPSERAARAVLDLLQRGRAGS